MFPSQWVIFPQLTPWQDGCSWGSVPQRSVVQLRLRARHGDVADHAETLEQALPPEARSELVRIGLVEALTNAIVHGALGVASGDDVEVLLSSIAAAEAKADRVVRAEVHRTPSEIAVVIADEGAGFDWRAARPVRGRGLAIVKEVFECVSWNEVGNEVRLRLRGSP